MYRMFRQETLLRYHVTYAIVHRYLRNAIRSKGRYLRYNFKAIVEERFFTVNSLINSLIP